jgi:molybdopterin converting factor subunit 1
MRVRVLYFGVLKDLFGQEREELELADGSTVGTLLALMKQHATAREGVWESIAVAVNQEYVRASMQLNDGDEVALLPPVSGGTGEGSKDAD